MQIRFLKEHGMYHPGMVTDQIQGGVADLLIRRRIAEAVQVAEVVATVVVPDVVPIEVVTAEPPVDATDVPEEPKAAKPRTRK